MSNSVSEWALLGELGASIVNRRVGEMAGVRRCGRTILCLAIVVQLCVVAGEGLSQTEDPQTPVVTICGHVTRFRDGQPITAGQVRVYRDTTVPAYWDLELNGEGYFEGRFQSGVHYFVWPIYGNDEARSALIRSIPQTYDGILFPETTICDFQIKPGVVAALDREYGDPTIGGVQLSATGSYFTPPLPAFIAGSNQVVFYPDDYSDYYGLMPLSGQLVLSHLQPFCVAAPQNSGQYMLYDCSSTYIDIDAPKIHFQSVVPASDVPANYSWDSPGGIGYRYFPKTPDNRLPNNPNVYVTAEFGDALRYSASSTINKDFVRMNGVSANEDLTLQNNYTATFEFPIPACGPMDLRIEYLVRTDGPNYQFYPLATHLETGASNADINDDGNINISDLPLLAMELGHCAGQPEYNPCSDLQPDNCVNTADVSVFAASWNWPSKSVEVPGIVGATMRFVATEGGSYECIVDAPDAWSAGVVRFALDGLQPGDVLWTPSSDFFERSLLAPYADGGGIYCDLFAFGPAAAGATVIGEISVASKVDAVRPRLLSAALAERTDEDGTATPAGSAVARLGDVAPNPFNPSTVLSFELPAAQGVSLVVYDLSGRVVRTLVDDEVRTMGRHEVRWDGVDDRGRAVASGVYLYRLLGSGVDLTKRMTLLE